MSRYRVKVESYVVVEARNQTDARAKGEQAVRRAVREDYAGDEDGDVYADAWERFGFQAKSVERLPDDDD